MQCPSQSSLGQSFPLISGLDPYCQPWVKSKKGHFHMLISDHLAEHHPISNWQWGFNQGSLLCLPWLAQPMTGCNNLKGKWDWCNIFRLRKGIRSSTPPVVNFKTHVGGLVILFRLWEISINLHLEELRDMWLKLTQSCIALASDCRLT